MRQKKDPPKPFYPLRHEFDETLRAFELAAGQLYNTATTVLSIYDRLPDSGAAIRKLFDTLRDAAKQYEKVTHGHG